MGYGKLSYHETPALPDEVDRIGDSVHTGSSAFYSTSQYKLRAGIFILRDRMYFAPVNLVYEGSLTIMHSEEIH